MAGRIEADSLEEPRSTDVFPFRGRQAAAPLSARPERFARREMYDQKA